MTGARPPRGGGRDPWRGARPAPPEDDRASATAANRHAELEEIGDVQIARPRGARPGAGPTVAAVLLVGLLAAGMGFLGGRPDASPTSSPGAGPTAGAAVPSGGAPPTPGRAQPVVTPFVACTPDSGASLAVLLETNTTPVPGLIQAIDGGAGGTVPTLPPAGTGPHGPHVDIRPDAVTEIWIDGGRCAIDWAIELYDPRTDAIELLEAISNATLDPAYAAQNRFGLASLAAYRGGDTDLELRAGLSFEDSRSRVRASWAVRILPLEWPAVSLEAGRRDVPVVPGCFVLMQLGNGWAEQAPGTDCEDDVSGDLPPPTRVRPGESLELRFAGWTATNALAICGHLSGRSFVAEPVPGCWTENNTGGTFDVPDDGGWTLQIGACAAQDANQANTICGTWYAEIEVR